MPFTVKVPRTIISSASDGLQWSQDGKLALPGSQCLVIVSPTTKIPEEESEEEKKKDLRYDVNFTISLDDIKSHYKVVSPSMDETFSVTATTSEFIFVQLDWSPSGMDLVTRGCLLVGLSSHGQVIIFHQVGTSVSRKWEVKRSINLLLIGSHGEVEGDGNGGGNADGNDEVSYDDNQMKNLRFHSLSWSDRVNGNEENKWGTSYLAVGSELGNVIIFEVNSMVLKKVCEVNVTDEWITGLKWSKCIDNTSVLMISTSSNQVLTKIVRFKVNGDGVNEISIYDGEIILPSSRFLLSTQEWYYNKEKNTHILAVVRIRHVDIFLFSNGKCEKTINLVTTFSSLPSSLLIHQLDDIPSIIQITTTSCKGESYSVNIDKDKFIESEQNDNNLCDIITSFVNKRKRRTNESLITSFVNFQCFGAALSPHGNYIALSYTLVPIDKLRYPILSQQSCRVVFLPITNKHVVKIPEISSIVDGSSICNWWEIKTLKSFLPRDDRAGYVNKIIESIEGDIVGKMDNMDIDSSTSSVQDIVLQDKSILNKRLNSIPIDCIKQELSKSNLQTVINNFIFKSLDKERLLLYLGVGDKTNFIRLLSTIILLYINQGYDLESLSSLDKAMLLSYNHFASGVPLYKNEDTIISISGGFFDETFDFSKESTIDSITSENSILWRRCSVTLIPLTSKDLLTCEGCGLKRFKEVGENQLISLVLEFIDVCMYCGSHYEER